MQNNMQRPAPIAPENTRQPEDSSKPAEFAPNSTQPVEAVDKANQTHNPVSQQHALQQNEDNKSSKGPAHPGHAAAQHAIGSFSGGEESNPAGAEQENKDKKRKNDE